MNEELILNYIRILAGEYVRLSLAGKLDLPIALSNNELAKVMKHVEENPSCLIRHGIYSLHEHIN